MVEKQQFDITIIGAGLVGLSLAFALKDSGLSVALVNAKPASDTGMFEDGRALALTLGTQQVYQQMGIWPDDASMFQPIKQTSISQQGAFSRLRINADQMGQPALGYVVPFGKWGKWLWENVKKCAHVTWFEPATLKSYELNDGSVSVNLKDSNNTVFTSKLLVGADGGRSTVRDLSNIEVENFQYNQVAMVSTVNISEPHNGRAFERFMAGGPFAVLPLPDNKAGIVWCVPADRVDHYKSMSDAEYLEGAQKIFGYKFGKFKSISKRSCFPLSFQRSKALIKDRVILVGNAAHQIHPMAAQGFNLGFRDSWGLAQHLIKESDLGHDIGDTKYLQKFIDSRRHDQDQIKQLSDRTVRVFSNKLPILKQARGLGLLMNDFFPLLKKRLANKMMGLVGG